MKTKAFLTIGGWIMAAFGLLAYGEGYIDLDRAGLTMVNGLSMVSGIFLAFSGFNTIQQAE